MTSSVKNIFSKISKEFKFNLLFDLADSRMYEGKKSGKNKVV